MNKIEQIEQAIEKALRRESKLTHDALMVPALASLNIRHLLNNLGAISTNYGECGIHKSGSFCSAVFMNDNLKYATGIDNFLSDFESGEVAEKESIKNTNAFTPITTRLKIIKSDAFQVDLSALPPSIDMYLYDASHSEQDQYNGLIYYLPAMADEFIFLVDDFDWEDVQKGTQRAILDSGVEVLFHRYFKSEGSHDNESWFNGYGIYLLKKKS